MSNFPKTIFLVALGFVFLPKVSQAQSGDSNRDLFAHFDLVEKSPENIYGDKSKKLLSSVDRKSFEKITAQERNNENCYLIEVSQTNSLIDYYEFLQENKQEGMFYTFDDVKRTVTIQNRILSNDLDATLLTVYFCDAKTVKQVTMVSCTDQLNKNKKVFKTYINK